MVNPMKTPEQRRKEFLENLAIIDNSKSVLDWLNSCKESVKGQYLNRWSIWIQYCKSHGLKTLSDKDSISGDLQLEDMKQRRLNTDNGIKFFYDNEVPNFFNWLKNEYIGKQKKHFAEGSALSTTTAVRSFFHYHRYDLDIQKDKLPSSEKIKNISTDHPFTIYELRSMFNQGDLSERTVLDVGVNLWLRVGDFAKLDRETVQLAIEREKQLAVQEKRETQTIEFEIVTEKESEPCSCHLSREAIELLEEYLKTYPQKNGYLFPYQVDNLNDIVKRLAVKAQIKLGKHENIRWHCLRKFGVTVMHGKIQEPVMKYMCGKHIESALKTYIQANNETFKAFKLIEPLISLTKSNGNGNSTVTKELEKLKAESFKNLAMLKLMEKITPKEEMQKAIIALANEFGIKLKTETKVKSIGEGGSLETYQVTVIPSLNDFINEVGKAIEKKDLERVLTEVGNGEH
jgi:integrase